MKKINIPVIIELIVATVFKFIGMLILIISGIAIGDVLHGMYERLIGVLILALIILLVSVAFDALEAVDRRKEKS